MNFTAVKRERETAEENILDCGGCISPKLAAGGEGIIIGKILSNDGAYNLRTGGRGSFLPCVHPFTAAPAVRAEQTVPTAQP